MQPPGRRIFHWIDVRTLAVAIGLYGIAGATAAAALADKARESGCAGSPRQVEGAMYKCETASGAWSYFNVPEGSSPAQTRTGRTSQPGTGSSAKSNTTSGVVSSGFPKIGAETQKVRDDLRRKVLQDELSAEERLLAEARTAHANGAPPPLPEERDRADRYRERIARLRQAVTLHERNVEALRKELAGLR